MKHRLVAGMLVGIVSCAAPKEPRRDAVVPPATATASVPPAASSVSSRELVAASSARPTVSVAPHPAPPKTEDHGLAIEFHEHDHRVSYSAIGTHHFIASNFALDIVVKTDPPQRRAVGRFNLPHCHMSESGTAPIIARLHCIHGGTIGLVELIRKDDGKAEIVASEGGDGKGSRPARKWKAGVIDVPDGLAVAPELIDDDAERRAQSTDAPLAVSFQSSGSGLLVVVNTNPPQSLAVKSFDITGCWIGTTLNTSATVAFVECSPAPGVAEAESLLLAYVGSQQVELWGLRNSDGITARGRRILGRLNVPRDRAIEVELEP